MRATEIVEEIGPMSEALRAVAPLRHAKPKCEPEGPLDVLCTLDEGHGYDELLDHTVSFNREGASLRVLDLPRLIQAKSNANRPKDRAVLPLLIATLDERRKK